MIRQSTSGGIYPIHRPGVRHLTGGGGHGQANLLSELVWYHPGDSLALNFGLIVDSLDGEEDFPKCVRVHNEELPFRC